MNAALIAFAFEDQVVRVSDLDGNPWFVATDLCRILDIRNVTQATARLDADERSMLSIGRQGESHDGGDEPQRQLAPHSFGLASKSWRPNHLAGLNALA